MKGIRTLSIVLILLVAIFVGYVIAQHNSIFTGNFIIKKNFCGDGICKGKETQSNCCRDCGCTTGKTCYSSQCVIISCFSNSDCSSDPANCKAGVCNNPGTVQAFCSQVSTCTGNKLCCSGSCTTPACSSNSQCGSNICSMTNSTRLCTAYQCINPGTCSAYCTVGHFPGNCTVGQAC